MPASLEDLLTAYRPRTETEAGDLGRVLRLTSTTDDPWSRSHPVHVTSSALIVHPPSGRVLLRWHQRHGRWLHVGGHGDPGETVPLDIALREAREETGLDDVAPWPDERLVHVVIAPVPASPREPAHEHADLRFVLATAHPEAARPEDGTAQLRWLSVAAARETTTSPSLRETIDRVRPLLAR